ncbi:COP1-interactive protein 1-like isoform X1 [Cucurbita moschata]|uniref:COP1-interactive protein 1-like isoform X1 n=1 Tax=Cucurbita moschata TaxID=3662 RepID=A0A6J1EZ25_CUCMO|nr:COP1-interactive protein 1-like isoform X1 [Cucurbita moschata]XP_022931298.1 COP1-interactive protein 1-like isoform X1 [Cucurbita moschata]XP_022931299.1 COP1-interactive protein 1-like isoform X1 [Cucurbita moschata]XP_022931300.1 COP1-interactive protein 1-like isoform X1 [Cucurbita moschata]XP_022931301.1 COP1-interactive protein 1-like isoform X1 [Cucurbita moschata]XP_022931302.1 COP1-interactive protein 1-like isoform X2 [Cucurbita moschata]XP_022931303.1 COP1-interactive protein 1
MTKHRFRNSLKSLFGSYLDPETNERLRGNKSVIEDKVNKIRQLIKGEDLGVEDHDQSETRKKQSIDELFDDFLNVYQALYEQYDSLTGELRRKFQKRREKESSSSSSSDSDSDDSSKKKVSKDDRGLEREFQEVGEIKQELDAALSEVADLKRILATTIKEHESLNTEHLTALSKIQEADGIIRDLKVEAEIWDSQKSKFQLEIEELNLALSNAGRNESELNERLKGMETEMNNYIEEKETARRKIEEGEKTIDELKALADQLKEKLSATMEEKEALNSQHLKTLSRVHEADMITRDLKVESETWGGEKSKFLLEIEELNQKLGAAGKLEAQLNERLKDIGIENEYLIKEKESAQRTIEEMSQRLSNAVKIEAELNGRLKDIETEKDGLIKEKEIAWKEIEQGKRVIEELNAMVDQLNSQLTITVEEKKSLNLQLEKEKVELLRSIADHQRNLKEHEDAYKKLNDEFQECKLKLDNAEMMMAEMSREFLNDIRSKEQVKDDLELMVEDLKRELEVKSDEINSLVENARTIEVKLRLSNQKLRVTEQLLTEKEEIFRKAELKYQKERKLLEERIHGLSATVVTNKVTYQKTISTVSENINSNLSQLECVIRKFILEYAKYEKCVMETSRDLRLTKSWVSNAIEETEGLKKEVADLGKQLEDKKERESILVQQVEKLEIKANKEGSEKDGLVEAIHELEKRQTELEKLMEEKNEGMVGLKEEKKEAIRQLCMLIEYHRDRYDFLKDEVLKLNVKGGQSVR